MCDLESLKIDLRGLKEDRNVFECPLDDAYFEALGSREIHGGDLHLSLSVDKASGFYDLGCHISGSVRVACDLCLEDMEQAVNTNHHFVVKLGGESSAADDVVIVDEGDGVLDLSWLIYEQIVLALPVKRVHVAGSCNPDMMEALKRLSPEGDGENGSDKAIDPRWKELLKLKD